MRKVCSLALALALTSIPVFSGAATQGTQATASDEIAQLKERIGSLENANDGLTKRLGHIEDFLSRHNLVAFSVVEDVPPQLLLAPSLPPVELANRRTGFLGWLRYEENTICRPFSFRLIENSRWTDSVGHDKASITCRP